MSIGGGVSRIYNKDLRTTGNPETLVVVPGGTGGETVEPVTREGLPEIPVYSADTRRLVSLTEELIKKQDLTNRYLSLLTSANLGEQNDGT